MWQRFLYVIQQYTAQSSRVLLPQQAQQALAVFQFVYRFISELFAIFGYLDFWIIL